jgi:hypothetical protein
MSAVRESVMTARFLPLVALSSLCNFGSAQDNVVSLNPGYGVQGSLAVTRAQNEADMQRALQRARETRALKEAMAAYAPTRQIPSTPAQFLTANRPAPPLPQSGGAVTSIAPVERVPEVPYFEKPVEFPSPEPAPSPSPVSIETPSPPASRGGLLDRLFKREKEAPETASSNSQLPLRGELPPAPPVAPAVPPTVSSPSPDRIPEPPSFRETAPSPRAGEPSMAEKPILSSPPEPEEEIAPIFQRRVAPSAAGETATVTVESEATVSGVLVRLYKGDQVRVLSRNGSEATIRLADQRVGTINAGVLKP